MKHPCYRLVAFTLSVILSCHPAAVLSQTTTGSLSGTVTDVRGFLIPRATIQATPRDALSVDARGVFETKTDDQGKFTLKNLPAGVYRVRAGLEGSGVEVEKIVSVPKGKSVEIAIELGHACAQLSEARGFVSDKDKAQVLRLTLTQAVSSKLALLDQKQRDNGVILSTENIKPEWVKDVPGIKISLMAQKQIRRKAEREGDFLFLSFPEIRARGQCIAVTVANTWAVGKHSRTVYLSGGGYTYEYRKQSGKWVGKLVNGWVS